MSKLRFLARNSELFGAFVHGLGALAHSPRKYVVEVDDGDYKRMEKSVRVKLDGTLDLYNVEPPANQAEIEKELAAIMDDCPKSILRTTMRWTTFAAIMPNRAPPCSLLALGSRKSTAQAPT
jgi:hypothetical protein